MRTFHFAVLCLISTACLLGTVFPLHAQQDPYAPRGVRAYLVNYGAIGGDRIRAQFAARRFVLLDEAQSADIPLVRAVAPAMPILVYRDVVALHAGFPEFAAVNRDERAFLHSAEPSSLCINGQGDSLSLWWMPDRRMLSVTGYRVLGARDSLATPFLISDSIVTATTWRGRVPDSAQWILIASVTEDGTALDYGAPVRAGRQDPQHPRIALRAVTEARTDTSVRFRMEFACIGGPDPDSLAAIVDLDRNNSLDAARERRRLRHENGLYVLEDSVRMQPPSHGGFECVVDVYADTSRQRFPDEGAWTTSPNNRIMNDYYSFYVMNVGCSTWRRAYIGAVLDAFAARGYSGLFEDDTWYRVEPWGVDAFPPVAYAHNQWRADLYGFLDSIRTMIAPRPAYFNGLYAAGADNILVHTDGGMTEGFGYTHWSGYVSGTSWTNLCNIGLRTQHAFRKLWLALGGAPADDGPARLYTLASHLLVDDTLAIYGNATSYQEFSHMPEFDIPLGRPLETAGLSIDTLRIPGTPLYARRFEHGTVVVNPSATQSGTVASGGNVSVALLGGLTFDGGRVTSTPADVTIPPKQARIFLASGLTLTSPLIDSIDITPMPVPADGATGVRLRVRTRDSSSAVFRSDPALPLRVTADLGVFGGPRRLVLTSDGTPAGAAPAWHEASFTVPVGAPPTAAAIPVIAEATTGLVTVAWLPVRTASADTNNLVLNFSFEIDNNDDGVPDLWRSYVKGFAYDTVTQHAHSGRRSIRVQSDSLTEFRGAFCSLILDQDSARDLVMSGWSRAADVSGSRDADYSLYADLLYADGTPLYGQTAQFQTGTHDWEQSTRLIHPLKPVKSLSLYLLFRRHSGEAWFDQVALRRADAPVGVDPVVAGSVPASFRVRDLWPQPALRSLTFDLDLRAEAHVVIALHSLLGTRLAVLHDGVLGAGPVLLHTPLPALPAGAYILTVTSGATRIIRRLAVLR